MTPEPRIDEVVPAAALPLGEVELIGANLGPNPYGPPVVVVGTHPAQVLMSRPGRVAFRIPENAVSGLVEVRTPAGVSNAAPVAHRARTFERVAPRDESCREPLRHDLRHHLRPAWKTDARFGGAREPGWTRHALRNRNPERHRVWPSAPMATCS